MKKMKALKITFEPLDEFIGNSLKTLQEVIKTKQKIARKNDTLVWASVEAYQQFMSDQKYAILASIHKYRPQSVYQLAKILNRAQQNVARDCDLLAGHGFIKFEESEEGRRSKAPNLIFEYNTIIVCLPRVTYRVGFEDAA